MADATQLVALAPLARFQEILKKISQMVEKSRKSGIAQRILRSTLIEFNHVVLEIKRYNEHLAQPREEIKTLIREKDAGEEGEKGDKCVNSCLQVFTDRVWHGKDDSDSVDADEKQALTAKDVKETLYKVREILELLTQEDGGAGTSKIKAPFDVPVKPDFTVGLDVPLSKLKMELLKDGVSVVAVTGLGGLGKTTLAAMVCWDKQIKGKFRENILFVTFSKTPNVKNIVERLFEHFGYEVPEFQSNDDAVYQLGPLFKKCEGNPLLLVLDDVWPGSEDLVEKFKVQISDYKILVTSRITFPRFGTPCVLKPLAHEDAITLFRHYALLKDSSSNIPDDNLVQKVLVRASLHIRVIYTCYLLS